MSNLMQSIQFQFYLKNIDRYELLVPNVYPFNSSCEMDLCGVRKSGFIDEIEIKATRSDYLADFKKTVTIKDGEHEPLVPGGYCRPKYVDKTKHEAIKAGEWCCNYFAFLMPRELADKHDDLPEYAGLYVFYHDNAGELRIKEAKSAKRLHTRKISSDNKYFLARKASVKYWHK